MLGSLQSWQTGPEVFRRGFAIERVRSDMWMIDIQSPEALMVRQLASQQTGFAIAGEGPVQSDLLPIIEYAAPEAFYRNDRSRMLDRFDERTRQQLLAPTEKRELLKDMPISQVQLVLSAFSTINGELYGSVFGNPAEANVPCVFETPNPAPAPGSSGTTLDQASLAFAAGDLIKAEQSVALALQTNPNDPMAGYLRRVVERAKGMRGATVSAVVRQ